MVTLTAFAPSKLARTLLVVSLTASALLVSSGPGEAAAPKAPTGVVPASGPARAAQMISLYGKGFATDTGNPLVDVTAHGASFATTKTCAADATAATTASQIDSGGVTVASATRLIISIAAASLDDGLDAKSGLETKKDYLLCIYSNNTDAKLVTSNKFSVFPAPTLAATNIMSPVSGPSVGGQAITVAADTSGTSTPASATKSGYYSSKMTVTLGGMPVAAVKVAKDGNSFTGVTPPLPPGPADLVVTTEGGTVTAPAAYVVVVGITVTPTAINPSVATIVSIRGKGFNAIKTAPNLGVVFVAGPYDQSTNPGISCPILSVVSDKEILCTSPTGALATTAYNVVVTDDVTSSTTATYTSIVSTGSTVTVGTF